MNKQQGLTLIELMVVMFLATIIMATVFNLYFYVKRNYLQAQEQLSSRFDLYSVKAMILRSVHQAGYTPCTSLEQLTIYDHRSSRNITPSSLSFENKPSGLLEIKRMTERFTEVKNIVTPYEINLAEKRIFKPGHPLIIADCHHAEIISRYRQYHNKVILEEPLNFVFTDAVYLGEYFEERWFIEKRQNKKASLYYRLSHKEELTPVVNSFAIKAQSTPSAEIIAIDLFWGSGRTYSFLASVRA
ncbi:MAG: hypothetical protein BGO90_15255 [Legionella sp. 40-6]|nr:prepilin-type N-terminal cleavage/methylation domain-containing protein [Legionella sp.]OJY30115.1 MAG: hypothetical protein BGO90_15255 [Legionella sp. 40-6]